MIEVQKAVFSFEEFKIPQFSYNEANDNGSIISIGFSPSGLYEKSKGIFNLKVLFIAYPNDAPEKVIFEVTSVAIFKFETAIELDEIHSFFYKNAIAIVFPYIRAFISTLTLQANTKLLKLELMNLSDLEKPLRENTKVI